MPAESLLRQVMQASDLDQVVALEQASYAYPWTRGIFADCLASHYLCWVLRDLNAAPSDQAERSGQGVLAGYLVASVAVGECHLLNICVAPPYRGQGCSDQLLAALLPEAVARGAQQLFLEVRPSNQAAQRLYQRFGFVEVGRRKHYYPGPQGREDALIWMCNLPG